MEGFDGHYWFDFSGPISIILFQIDLIYCYVESEQKHCGVTRRAEFAFAGTIEIRTCSRANVYRIAYRCVFSRRVAALYPFWTSKIAKTHILVGVNISVSERK